jgi:uncharacterized phiE125 gp8 family phage protein
MKWTLITPPATEPVSMAELKLHLRLDSSAEDATLQACLAAARQAVEAQTGLKLIAQDWRIVLDGWPGPVVTLPVAPVPAVKELRVRDRAGTAMPRPAADWSADLAGRPARLSAPGMPRPGVALGGIEIDVTAGFGPTPATVPDALRQAVRILATRLFEERGDGEPRPLPPEALVLMAPYRRVGV